MDIFQPCQLRYSHQAKSIDWCPSENMAFASLQLVAKDLPTQDKAVTALQISVISISTALIIAIFSAAIHLQRRKKKFIFCSDSCHQNDTYPMANSETGTTATHETHPNTYHAHARDRDHNARPQNAERAARPPLPVPYEEYGSSTHTDEDFSSGIGGSPCSDLTGSETDARTLVPECQAVSRGKVAPPSGIGSDSPEYRRDTFYLDASEYEGSVVVSSVKGKRFTEYSLYG